jgi:hypothetical protein
MGTTNFEYNIGDTVYLINSEWKFFLKNFNLTSLTDLTNILKAPKTIKARISEININIVENCQKVQYGLKEIYNLREKSELFSTEQEACEALNKMFEEVCQKNIDLINNFKTKVMK